jgi:hypothetical protein
MIGDHGQKIEELCKEMPLINRQLDDEYNLVEPGSGDSETNHKNVRMSSAPFPRWNLMAKGRGQLPLRY